jgi:hypothetical protein
MLWGHDGVERIYMTSVYKVTGPEMNPTPKIQAEPSLKVPCDLTADGQQDRKSLDHSVFIQLTHI